MLQKVLLLLPFYLLLSAFQAQGSSPCERPLLTPRLSETIHGQILTGKFKNDAGTRDYQLYLPQGYDSASTIAPLVVMLHGCLENSEEFAVSTGIRELADQEGFLVLLPEQSAERNHLRCWEWYNPSNQYRDIGETSLLADLVQKIRSDYRVDHQRVYVAGISAGGGMASILSSLYPDVFSAAAMHSSPGYGFANGLFSAIPAMKLGNLNSAHYTAGMAYRFSNRVSASMPVLVIQGDKDATVGVKNASDLIEHYRELHNLKQGKTATFEVQHSKIADWDELAQSENLVADVEEQLLDGQVFFKKIIVHDLDHAWSGGDSQYQFNDDRGPDATRLIWDFFRQHQH